MEAGPRSSRLSRTARQSSPSLLLVEVFVPQDLVKNPVEDVKEQEGQREAGPRHRVDLLRSVDEQLPHLLGAPAPAPCCRCILGSVGCRGDGVVDAGLGVFADAGSGRHDRRGGQLALTDFFLWKKGGGLPWIRIKAHDAELTGSPLSCMCLTASRWFLLSAVSGGVPQGSVLGPLSFFCRLLRNNMLEPNGLDTSVKM